MPHPPGYHKDEDAKERCWGCSHPELLEVSDADWVEAQRLIDEGWQQTSRKYRGVARVVLPPFEEAVKIAEGVPAWVLAEMKRSYEYLKSSMLSRQDLPEVVHLTLPIGVFSAFSKIRNNEWRKMIGAPLKGPKNTPHPEAPEPFDRGEHFKP